MNQENKSEIPEEAKKEVPQLNGAGVSYDYLNEIIPITATFEALGADRLIKFLKNEGRIKLYEERFSSSEHRNVITSQNQGAIARLNAMVEELNALIPSISEENIQQFVDKAKEIIIFVRNG